MLKAYLLAELGRRVQESKLPLAVRLWDGTNVGASRPRVTLTVKSPRALKALVNPTMGELAESYVEDRIDAEGSIRDVIRAGTALAETNGEQAKGWRRIPRWRRHTRQFDHEAIHSHYDVGDDFFGL